MRQLIRPGAATLAVAALVLLSAPLPRAQGVAPIDRRITYILPQWPDFLTVSDETVAQQVQQLRARIGEGPRVRVGFTTYVNIVMTAADPADAAAVRGALAGTFAQVDLAIARAEANGIPLCLSFLTAIRSGLDPAQAAAQAEDRRNMQWHADGSLAAGWTTFSRYARKQDRLQQAFIRELGRGLAARMLAHPDTLVAASGDGEIEMSFEKSFQFGGAATPADTIIADYSPFAIAEFRDWLRSAGEYAPGGAFAAEAYAASGRYAGDAAPNVDSNGDGHTLNGDFGTAFETWSLEHYDWSLSDAISPDPHAIPASAYAAAGWSPVPAQIPAGFDAPRVRARGNPWYDVWDLFRQSLVWRHNRDFAKWITTSADPASGATVPADRWFTDQIPADYLFGFTPSNPDLRLDTSASPYWTADVAPYGSLGITSFNANQNGTMFRTLAGVGPEIAKRGVRWGIFEWNPSLPVNGDVSAYRDEMPLVERYRPSLLVPFAWMRADFPVENTGFEVALRELVARIRVIPLSLSRSPVFAATTADGTRRTPAQTVNVSGAPGESPAWTIASASPFLDVALTPDGHGFTVAPKAQGYAPGPLSGTIVLTSSDAGYAPTTLNVDVQVKSAGATAAPVGSFDTPIENAAVSGEVPVTGWAVDDFGIAGVDIYRSPAPGEPTDANGLVFLGTATLVAGARPDVQKTFATSPLADKAGWGYMLLSNFLPNGGNGLFTLWAFARDVDGRTALLGSRRIAGQNSAATRPFGTIDTPAQGATVSGTIVNFGWALTPQPNIIPTDGSTITVFVDDVPLGHPAYNNFRSDIAGLFPGYQNSGGAVGVFVLDTTRLANGVHTIAWGVVDSAGNAQGVGSRFFTVDNR